MKTERYIYVTMCVCVWGDPARILTGERFPPNFNSEYVFLLFIAFKKSILILLKLQYFGHLIRRANSLKKTLMLGKIEGRRRRGQQRRRWLDGDRCKQTLGDSEGQGSLVYCSPWGRKELDMTEWLNNNNNCNNSDKQWAEVVSIFGSLINHSNNFELYKPIHLQGGRPGFDPWVGEGKGHPLQYSGLENYMDHIVQGVTKSQTQLSDFHFINPSQS